MPATKTKKLLEAWRSGYPSASNPYWRSLPLRKMKRLLAGAFLLAGVVGFATNLILLDRPALLGGFLWPLLMAGISTLLVIIRLRRPAWVPVAFPLAILIFALVTWTVGLAPPLAPIHSWTDLHGPLLFNGLGICFGVAFGLRLIMSFLSTQGVASVRFQTELDLALGMQAALVPNISIAGPRFEVYGISVPGTEMGGDLVDVITTEHGLLAYLADISGHGLPAGQLMGMLKTAVRISLQTRQKITALMEEADRVLPAVKPPHMFAAVAMLSFSENNELEYALAAHPPLLHYRKRSRDIVRLGMEQLPLGLLPGTSYTSARTPFATGDLFIVVTDGIIEVENNEGEEFGLDRLEAIVKQCASDPLPEIWQAMRAAALAHGPQSDDQSGLIVRVL